MAIDPNSEVPAVHTPRAIGVTISRSVNEPLPDVHKLLGSRDLAKLTRRPRWLLCGLSLIGKFPRKKRYRGRPLGWCRSEVMDWMARGLSVQANDKERLNAPRRCVPRHPRQTCLPLECRPPCSATRTPRRLKP